MNPRTMHNLMTPMLAVALSLLGTVAAAAPVEPYQSFHQLVSSNGRTAAIYDDTLAKLTGLREHCFAAVDASTPTRELAYDAYFGLRLSGIGTWLSETGAAPLVRYLPGTGVIESVQQVDTVEATTYVFAPFEVDGPVAVMLLRVKNIGAAALSASDAVYSIHNFHVGDGPDQTQNEQIDWDPIRGLFIERDGRVLVSVPLAPPNHHGCTPNNPYVMLKAGQDLADDSGSGITNDAVSGLQWSLSGLAPGAEAWVGVAFGYHPFGNDAEIAGKIDDWLASRDVTTLVSDEEGRWAGWHNTTVLPAGMSADEAALYQQQVALLRMGQVLEANQEENDYHPYGQVLAGLPPGNRNIAWVRDGMVAIQALLKSGHVKEARDALEFFLKAESGTYGGYVGAPYQISVARYFGNGMEESDSNQDGPNIAWDGFGMFLDGLDAYERATGDQQLAAANWDAITTKTADVLIGLATDNGLLQADSSIWETHWDNGGRQHWTWSQLYGVLGLQAAASICERHGQQDLADTYSQAAMSLRQAIVAKLVDPDGFLRGRLESTPVPEDAAVVEAFFRSVLDPTGTSSRTTLGRLESTLAVASGHGYRRNLGPSDDDARERIFVDLRMASVMRWLGQTDEADALLAWITDQSRKNYDLIAENYDPSTAAYEGEVPTIGFGAGAYVLALFARNETPGCDGDHGSWTPQQCPFASEPVCLTSGAGANSCVQCTTENASACASPSPVCDSNANLCVACNVDEDCPSDRRCDGHTCEVRAPDGDGSCQGTTPCVVPAVRGGGCSQGSASPFAMAPFAMAVLTAAGMVLRRRHTFRRRAGRSP